MSFYRTDGPVMPYAWGSPNLLAEFLGRVPSGGPEAELWMGVHPRGPAQLSEAGGRTLRDLLGESPEDLLGPEVFARFGGLPFLMKVLAIGAPLSLQVHPDREQARAGFAREEALGIALSSPARNYRDENHKPELLVAVSEMEALCGFREPGQILSLFRDLGLGEDRVLGPVLGELEERPDAAGLERAFRALLNLDRAEVAGLLGKLPKVGAGEEAQGEGSAVLAWVERLRDEHGPDPGILACLLLRHVRLAPGEALYLGPHRLHAYLSGLGVEVMASSDNVLRGGLTQKHVDVSELTRVLDFSPTEPQLVLPQRRATLAAATTIEEWIAPAEEFQLLRVRLDGGELVLPAPSLILVTEGQVTLSHLQRREVFRRGDQIFCSASGPTRASGAGEFYCATVPQA